MAGHILIAATSATKLLDGRETGCWVEEVAVPYFLWREKGFQVDICSHGGGAIPWDEASCSEGSPFYTAEAQAFMRDSAARAQVDATPALAQVLAGGIDCYHALFIPGGHGICFDGTSPEFKALVEAFWAAGKVVSAVCHGPCSLTAAVDGEGNSIVKGREVAGFSNAEEAAVGKEKAVPYLLEDKLKELGGLYTVGPDWAPHAVASGKLITGQNPGSSQRVAELVIEAVAPGIKEPVHGKGPHEGLHKREKRGEDAPRHNYRDEHPRQGARHDAPDPAKQTSSWHQPYRPPI